MPNTSFSIGAISLAERPPRTLFEKAPIFDSVFLNFNNENINEDAENQKITSYELGYGYRGEKFSANMNLYYTTWRDRTETETFQLSQDETGIANILGVNAVHQGIELDFVYRPFDNLKMCFRL